jgi:hypothetical protein
MGYHRDIHYVIGREPTEAWKRMWNWQAPRTMPLDSKYAIYYYNGSVQVLISQDRIGSSNGLSLAYIGGDEAKLLNKERLDDEVMPTLRGDRSHFGHQSCYRSKMFLTDMPTSQKAKWILEKEAEMDKKQIELILQVQLHINILRKEMMNTYDSKRVKLHYKINQLEQQLNKLRMGSVYYGEASVLDNLDVLGKEFLDDMRKQLTPAKFDSSIMNLRNSRVENGFYPELVLEHHGQEWVSSYGMIDDLDYDFEQIKKLGMKKDGGMLPTKPLDISFDYGAHINCMVVGQRVGDEYRVHNALHVLHPQLISDLVMKFCEYYKDYPTKRVIYYYDHTAIAGSGVTEFTYKSQVVDVLRKNKWEVVEKYCGHAPAHNSKYDFYGHLLTETNPVLPKFRYNRINCEKLEASLTGAGIKQGAKGFEKDKSTERDPAFPQEDSTHLSDALDTLLFFQFHEQASTGAQTPYIPFHST